MIIIANYMSLRASSRIARTCQCVIALSLSLNLAYAFFENHSVYWSPIFLARSNGDKSGYYVLNNSQSREKAQKLRAALN